ncbi:carboxypeptidase regulatory-like domain-containing protein [Pseudonocardia sp. H11422]|uniref:carboxypeptidase regulatory-like domain-containing protein n=1 Tax=Pseudonocardia sp. H11422 TaxID=2835866 RepID=UPI001BDD2306|nr:carboxypeptidase regulatory-like domain-containing protein [Pseudonocardia sp. H11422]
MTSALGLIGLCLGVIVVAGLVVLLRKRGPAGSAAGDVEDPGRPRTVAELVELRAAAARAGSAAGPADGEPVTGANPAEPTAGREPIAVGPATEPARPAAAEPATREISAPAEPRRAQPAAPPVPLLGRDTVSAPWGRVPDGSLTLPAAAPPIVLSAPSEPPAAPSMRRDVSGFGDRPIAPVETAEPIVSAADAQTRAAEGPDPDAPAPAHPESDAPEPAASEATDPATGDWSEWTDWGEIDGDEDNGRSEAPLSTPDPTPAFGLAVVPKVVPAATVAETPDGEQDDRPPAAPSPTRESRAAARAAARAAEQAAADISLLRTLGFANPNPRPGAAAAVSLAAPAPVEPEVVEVSADAQPVRFRAVRRDGVPVPDAAMTLLDGQGREAGSGVADVDGRGVVAAPRAGDYVLVSAAKGHQPGAVALTVDSEPLDVEVLLIGSCSVAGIVCANGRPVDGATVTLLQEGEVVDAVDTGGSGRYRIGDLAAGDYTLAVTSPGHDPLAAVVRVPEQADVEYDVELERSTTAAGSGPPDHVDDVVGPR